MISSEARDLRLRLAVEDLCEVLDRLSDQHRSLLDILGEKQSALTEVEIDRIAEIQTREQDALTSIIEDEKERLLVTEEIGDLLEFDYPAKARVSEMAPHLEVNLAERLLERRDRLQGVAETLVQQNQRNRALIEHSMGHVQLFVTELVNQGLSTGTYGPEGPKTGDSSFLMDRRG